MYHFFLLEGPPCLGVIITLETKQSKPQWQCNIPICEHCYRVPPMFHCQLRGCVMVCRKIGYTGIPSK